MALSVKIQGLPRDDGQAIWCLDEVSWWPARELIKDGRFRPVDSDGYRDHVAVLSPAEAREVFDRYRKRGVQMDPGGVRLLEEKLALRGPASCWVVVVVYAWESGYDF
jgi:hypothetical protein